VVVYHKRPESPIHAEPKHSYNYGVYRNWVNRRQACLANLIRKASGLAERADESCRRFGEQLKEVLQQLCAFAHSPPGKRGGPDFTAA